MAAAADTPAGEDVSTFPARLRLATADAHRRLEDSVGFTPDAVPREKVLGFLEGMYGFLRPWEAWVASSGVDPHVFAPRCRLELLENDLRELGSNPTELPRYDGGFGAQSAPAVYGSAYVIEGSTLGGRLIARWLDGAEWLPSGGLGYFTANGRDTGYMWRAFQHELGERARHDGEEGIVAAARATFERLQGWLGRQKEP